MGVGGWAELYGPVEAELATYKSFNDYLAARRKVTVEGRGVRKGEGQGQGGDPGRGDGDGARTGGGLYSISLSLLLSLLLFLLLSTPPFYSFCSRLSWARVSARA